MIIRRHCTWVLALGLLATALGCTPRIGDDCNTSVDCSQQGDRLCDNTQPNGYCTVFNCEPDTCPDGVCVAFHHEIDPACGTLDDGSYPRFERTFCVAGCNIDVECRAGYACVDPTDRGGFTVDTTPSHPKVCLVALSDSDPLPSEPPGVCSPGNATLPAPYEPPDPAAGGGGSGGAGGN